MPGVDEFAWRRGKKYGTILVNLETGTPVDLRAFSTKPTCARAIVQGEHNVVGLFREVTARGYGGSRMTHVFILEYDR